MYLLEFKRGKDKKKRKKRGKRRTELGSVVRSSAKGGAVLGLGLGLLGVGSDFYLNKRSYLDGSKKYNYAENLKNVAFVTAGASIFNTTTQASQTGIKRLFSKKEVRKASDDKANLEYLSRKHNRK